MKVRRSDRLIDMTRYLLERPHTLVPLTFFSKRYESAKSSISEDLTILKRTFQERGTGLLETVPGAAGGTRFLPYILKEEATEFVGDLMDKMTDKSRYLPGGYVYMSDLLGDPETLRQIGRIFATQYLNQEVDAVMTIATKGVPIAQGVANLLNVPFVIVRHDIEITEGSTVNVNYVSGSSERIEKMSLSKRSLKKGANVLIVDDYMRGGGTISGMISMVDEFEANLVGIGVVAESSLPETRKIGEYTSLMTVDAEDNTVIAKTGNYLDRIFN
ncbi:pur operon repressor [Lentilactobacillus kosonis]|uniref:PurR: transcription regulator associated with purine metabolism n=1 Tax=Lentilactobacillus kosonis TaxID=2810561 RepID=A0A401FPB4_9LACO|nr:pur operon repressor [Lentilactobacillus kosonis]GAY74204.1 PurR: transcription regulator associated with purine metabolism [Lentilactobacillus kosonis]